MLQAFIDKGFRGMHGVPPEESWEEDGIILKSGDDTHVLAIFNTPLSTDSLPVNVFQKNTIDQIYDMHRDKIMEEFDYDPDNFKEIDFVEKFEQLYDYRKKIVTHDMPKLIY